MSKVIFQRNVMSLQRDKSSRDTETNVPGPTMTNKLRGKTSTTTTTTTTKEASHRIPVKRLALDQREHGVGYTIRRSPELNHRQMANSQGRMQFEHFTLSLCLSLSVSSWSRSATHRSVAVRCVRETSGWVRFIHRICCRAVRQSHPFRARINGWRSILELEKLQFDHFENLDRRWHYASLSIFRLFGEFPKLEQAQLSF